MKKKILLSLLVAVIGIGVSSFGSCDKGKPKGEPSVEPVALYHDYDGVVQDFTAGVSHVQALHRQTMFNLYEGKQYAWYETRVLFNDSISDGNLKDLKVVDVTDIFQTFNPAMCQYISTNVVKGTIIPPAIPDIWCEDCDMSELPIKVSAEQVLEILAAWDGIIPPAVGMTLRCPLGPKTCNAQWVIGNIVDVIFVDAVTGYVSDWCPAFPQIEKPLGEWP